MGARLPARVKWELVGQIVLLGVDEAGGRAWLEFETHYAGECLMARRRWSHMRLSCSEADDDILLTCRR